MPDSREVTSRLAHYRPVLDRVLFVLALLGVLTTVHLQIQEGRGFDRGCLGFTTTPAVEASFNCEAVTQSAAGTMGGVSNGVLGMFFYLIVGGLTAGAAFSTGSRRVWLKRGRVGLVAVGFAYSAYLSYVQYFVLNDLCALCLISASLATLLFIGQATELSTSPSSGSDMSLLDKARSVRFYAAAAVVILALVGADVLYFNTLIDPDTIDFDQVTEAQDATAQPVADVRDEEATATAPAESVATPEASSAVEAEGASGEAEAVSPATTSSADPVASEAVTVPEGCEYDPESGTVTNYGELVSMSDPSKGTLGAPVTVIEYFDPMCPHCKYLAPIMKEVAAEKSETAHFVYKPVVLLGQRSVAPVGALHHAAREGKFFEMLDLIFANQKPSGYSVQELRGYAQQLGMSPEVLENRLRGGVYAPLMKRQREEFIANGFSSVPTVMINGQVVKSSSRSTECLTSLIEQAASN
jgi:protein-disulfide isomerase/uncharacterized membrane protein